MNNLTYSELRTLEAMRLKRERREAAQRASAEALRKWRMPSMLTRWMAQQTKPRFPMTWCSQCGRELGPGDHGLSHCADHRLRGRYERGY